MGFYNLETLKEDAKRHAVNVLNPDINKSSSVCVIEDGKLRLGFLNVSSLGSVAAKGIEAGRMRDGPFRDIGDFLERSGILEEVAFNLADAGAFDSVQPNRREAKWEIGLRYRPVNTQMALQLPVEQDMTALDAPGKWERMKEEYNVLCLYPTGHIMEHMRPRFRNGFSTSADIEHMRDGAEANPEDNRTDGGEFLLTRTEILTESIRIFPLSITRLVVNCLTSLVPHMDRT